MRITWVIAGELSIHNGRIHSQQGSLRYRCLIPAEGLMARGHTIEFIRADTLSKPSDVDDDDFGDTVVFAKSFHPISEILAARARHLGRRVVTEICDYDFAADSPLRDHRRKMFSFAHAVASGSPHLADVIVRDFALPRPVVIDDPYELPGGNARFAITNNAPLRLVWYGVSGNLPDLLKSIDGLAALGRPIILRVITSQVPGLEDAFAATTRKFDGQLRLNFVEWSVDAVTQGLAEADVAIIPTATNDDTKKAKTSNRLVEALHAGRFVVAAPIPAYQPFAAFTRLDDDIAHGLRWTLDNAAQIEDRINAGQDYVERYNSPQAVSEQWERVIRG